MTNLQDKNKNRPIVKTKNNEAKIAIVTEPKNSI